MISNMDKVCEGQKTIVTMQKGRLRPEFDSNTVLCQYQRITSRKQRSLTLGYSVQLFVLPKPTSLPSCLVCPSPAARFVYSNDFNKFILCSEQDKLLLAKETFDALLPFSSERTANFSSARKPSSAATPCVSASPRKSARGYYRQLRAQVLNAGIDTDSIAMWKSVRFSRGDVHNSASRSRTLRKTWSHTE